MSRPAPPMELDWSWGEVARACGGTLLRGGPEGRVSSIGIDTRRLRTGQVYWALRGPHLDGHDFLAQAGAAAGWVVGRGRALPPGGPVHVLEVPDTLAALHALAGAHRRRFDIPIAAVAGSNGKTSTKEMLRSICAQRGEVCATEGNLNNQFGLPLSALELAPRHRFGVFELGESHPGDIDQLARIVSPTVGVLTNVGPAHLEFLGSLEGVFHCLCELVRAAPREARFAVNLDDPWLAGLEGELGPRAITYGAAERATVRLLSGPPDSAELLVERRRVSVRLAEPGRVHRWNAAAAAAGALGMGLGPEHIARGLEAFRPAPMRFERRSHPSGAQLLCDAYNANPASMRAGIESFCEAFPSSRRVLVLGDMKELGPESRRLHRELGEWVASLPADAAFLAGEHMAEAAEAMRRAGRPALVRHAAGWDAWLAELRGLLGPGTAVFFKASRALGLEKLVETL